MKIVDNCGIIQWILYRKASWIYYNILLRRINWINHRTRTISAWSKDTLFANMVFNPKLYVNCTIFAQDVVNRLMIELLGNLAACAARIYQTHLSKLCHRLLVKTANALAALELGRSEFLSEVWAKQVSSMLNPRTFKLFLGLGNTYAVTCKSYFWNFEYV